MAKPDLTLEPSKAAISQMAAQIYAAYITRGAVKDGEEASWMQRSIKEAVRIARTVDTSIGTTDESGATRETAAETSRTAEPAPAAAPPANPAGPSAAQSASKALEGTSFDDIVGEALSD